MSDVLVIGAGMAGLTAAALLKKRGLKVTVIEKNESAGGYFSSFQAGAYTFDYAISYILSCYDGGEVKRLVEELALTGISFKKLTKQDHIIFPDKKEFSMPSELEAIQNALVKSFPLETENIKNMIKWLIEYNEGAKKVSENLRVLPPRVIMTNFLKDFESFLNSKINDNDLRTIFSVRNHASPSSLLIMAGFINEYMMNGMYYIEGGAFQLPLALERYIEGGGCSVKKSMRVISLEDTGDLWRVKCNNGEIFTAKHIISNADPFSICRMIEQESNNTPQTLLAAKKLNEHSCKRVIGHSSFSIFLGVKDLDIRKLDYGRIYLLPDSIRQEDMFRLYDNIESGKLLLDTILKVHIPTVHDSTLAPPGGAVLRIETDMSIDPFTSFQSDWRDNQEYQALEKQIADEYIKRVSQKLIPGLEQRIVYKRVIAPLEWRELFLSEKGSGTGWAHTVQNYFKDIFPTKTNIRDLYIIGQWGELASGIRQLILSAKRAVDAICGGKL